MTIKIGVVQFPGSNTERETSLAIKRVKMNPVEILWNSNQRLIRECPVSYTHLRAHET